jgi:hypothetical protein
MRLSFRKCILLALEDGLKQLWTVDVTILKSKHEGGSQTRLPWISPVISTTSGLSIAREWLRRLLEPQICISVGHSETRRANNAA